LSSRYEVEGKKNCGSTVERGTKASLYKGGRVGRGRLRKGSRKEGSLGDVNLS